MGWSEHMDLYFYLKKRYNLAGCCVALAQVVWSTYCQWLTVNNIFIHLLVDVHVEAEQRNFNQSDSLGSCGQQYNNKVIADWDWRRGIKIWDLIAAWFLVKLNIIYIASVRWWLVIIPLFSQRCRSNFSILYG